METVSHCYCQRLIKSSLNASETEIQSCYTTRKQPTNYSIVCIWHSVNIIRDLIQSRIMIVMEYLAGGLIAYKLVLIHKLLSNLKAHRYLTQILEA